MFVNLYILLYNNIGDFMRSIKENCTNEIIIKNSRFIGILIKINSSNVNDILDEIKIKYPKATHYCYAYIYNEVKRFSDDGEPGGTAGMPILNVLEKENLNNILAVVVRYFGGIKLGAGGLVRAYTKSITECLKISDLVDLEEGYRIKITFNYSDDKKVRYLLIDSIILDEKYDMDISFTCLVTDEILNKLNDYNVEIEEKVYIEKSSK